MSLAVADTDSTEADRKHGYRFGCDGIVNMKQAAEMLGGVNERTVVRRIDAGVFRVGREGGRVVICKRSILDYIASLEK